MSRLQYICRNAVNPIIFIVIALASAMPARAATKEDYYAEMQKFFNDPDAGLTRAVNAAQAVLSKQTPVPAFGRGQIFIARGMIAAGRGNHDQSLLDDAKKIVLACNKVVIDGVDVPDREIESQVAFSLYELVFAYKQLEELKMLTPEETDRTERMLKACASYWLKERPVQGDGNLDLRYALGVASVAQAFPNDPDARLWIKWSELTFYNILNYPKINGVFKPTTDMFRKRSLQFTGDTWKFLPDAEQPTPVFAPGIAENCNGYVGSTIWGWICLGEALQKQKEMSTPAVAAWLDGFYQQLMPDGVLPVYGDGSWASSPMEWLAIFEWMGRTYKKPEYRMAAQGILDYVRQQHQLIMDTSEAIEFLDDSIPVAAGAPRVSVLLRRQTSYGLPGPDKIILRGSGDDKSQPYVMLQAQHGGAHSHPFGGAISAYTLGQSVVLHDFGYDATASVFHNMLLVRPTSEDFLGFFGNPSGTLLSKIDKENRYLTARIPSPNCLNTDADCEDFRNVVYGRVAFDCVTSGEFDRSFNGRGYRHIREIAMEKDTGILAVFDSLECLSDGEFAAGPVWHAQKVLVENPTGFLIQDENPLLAKPLLYTCPPRPVWMALAGPKDQTKLEHTHWHFMLRNGHEEVMQDEHMAAHFTGSGTVGQTFCFLTVFAPQPEGSKAIPDDVRAEVDGNRATASVGAWEFRFGPQKLNDPSNPKPARFVCIKHGQVQALYTAAVLTEGNDSKWESK